MSSFEAVLLPPTQGRASRNTVLTPSTPESADTLRLVDAQCPEVCVAYIGRVTIQRAEAPRMITAIPASEIAEPIRSVVLGRMESTSHSHRIATPI